MVVDSQPCFKTSNACKPVLLSFFLASLHSGDGGGKGVGSFLSYMYFPYDKIPFLKEFMAAWGNNSLHTFATY